MRYATPFIVLLLAAVLSGPCAAQTPAGQYRAAARILDGHTDGFSLDNSPQGIAALKEAWAAIAQAAVQVLSEHPQATPQEIETSMRALLRSNDDGKGEEPPGCCDVVALGPHLYLIAQANAEIGTVFIVGLRNGKPAALWTIHDAGVQAADPRGLIGAWQAERASDGCRAKKSGHPPGTCGPLFAGISALPADSAGRRRFYVSALYAQGMGMTAAGQTSVWRWEGDAARLLWIDGYDVMLDQQTGASYADGILSIGTKEEFRTFYSCGGCDGRQLTQRLRVTDDAVVNLGKRPSTEETRYLDLLDELFWRLARGKPAADMANRQVLHAMKPLMPKGCFHASKNDYNCGVGMFMDASVKHGGTRSRVCFFADGLGRPYEFTIQSAHGQPRRILSVRATGKPGSGTCPKQ
jgi:hypothetical protein